MSDPQQPPGGYQPPQQPPGGYQPPQQPPAAPQPPQYQQPPQQPQYQQPPAAPQPPQYQQPPAQPGQFQPVNPQATSSGNGCLKAFLIVLAISVVLGILATVFFVLAVGKAVDTAVKTFGVADASDYEIKIDKCEISDLGTLKTSGQITNKASHSQAYNITVDFSDNDNVKIGSDGLIYTGSLSSGQKANWEGTGVATGTAPDKIQCKVTQVNYWGS